MQKGRKDFPKRFKRFKGGILLALLRGLMSIPLPIKKELLLH